MLMTLQSRQRGFSIIELMVAITLSLIILAALSVMFVTSSRARDEIARANEQIENGRYAMQLLIDDLRLAGYYGGFVHTSVPVAVPATLPNACYTATPTATNDTALEGALTLHVQGYDNGTNPSGHCANLATLTGYKAGTDILVIRRVSTCVAGTADCPDTAGQLYFQPSQCNAQLDSAIKYRLSTNTFDRTRRNCTTAADKRRFITHIYYVASNNNAGDGIPTLKRAEMRSANFATITPLVEGIEELEFEYGIDNAGNDGAPDAYTSSPDTFGGCGGPTAACSPNNWSNVMAVKIHLMARSTEASPGHNDTKTYTLGPDSFTPGGSFKRHVFEATVNLSNPAGLRQQ